MATIAEDLTVILSIARTPMGSMQGALSDATATDLGATAVKAAVERAGVSGDDIDRIYMGCVLAILLTHEMGHLILRTFLPEIRAQVRTTYLVHGSEDGILGASQDNDPLVAAHVDEIAKRQLRVGGNPDIGTFFVTPPIYASIMRQMVQLGRAQPGGQAACADWGPKATAYVQAQVALVPNLDFEEFSARTPTAAEQAQTTDFLAMLGQLVAASVQRSATSLAPTTKVPAMFLDGDAKKDEVDPEQLLAMFSMAVPPQVHPINPMSHLLGDAVRADVRPGERVLDMGTGCGVNGSRRSPRNAIPNMSIPSAKA